MSKPAHMTLSKSQYMKGLQCPKYLWLYKNKKGLMAEPGQQRLNQFETGHRVGELARQLFPAGIEVAYRSEDYQCMVDQTEQLINNTDVIYEGSFSHKGIFVRADILVRNESDSWNLFEVKASTKTKPEHKDDAAIQWYVINQQLPLDRAYLVHINTRYVREGGLDVTQLFAMDDITVSVLDKQFAIEARLNQFESMLEGGEPGISIGQHCKTPHRCDFYDYCWNKVPHPSVFDLYRLSGDKKFGLYHRGIISYEDITTDVALSDIQAIQVSSAIQGQPYLDRAKLASFISEVKYPVNFLDFETFQDVVPRFDGQKPYMNIPFQYSLHILHENGELEHKEFLAGDDEDPRPGLAQQLLKDITDTGTIMAYNQSFEKKVIHALASIFSQYDADLTALTRRFNDLLIPFSGLMYYHPDFNGSFSIKSVLPALFPNDSELDYKRLEIQNGHLAMDTFAHLYKVSDPVEKTAIRESLLAYCKLDTLAMVRIWQRLNALI
jgi:hypothetical protein